MRFVLCDEDPLVVSIVGTIVERKGHEVLGVADHTAVAANLVTAGRPDAVVVDLSLGYNTDFDLVEVSMAVGARVIVFSHNADHHVLDQFTPRPIVVLKPDFVALEEVVDRLRPGDGAPGEDALVDRRVRAPRAAIGPVPTDLRDAQAFYEALANAMEGDVIVSIEPMAGGATAGEDLARQVQAIVRSTDRVLAMATAVRVFMAGPGSTGLAALVGRLADRLPEAGALGYRSEIVEPGDVAAEVFDRLKQGDLRPLR